VYVIYVTQLQGLILLLYCNMDVKAE